MSRGVKDKRLFFLVNPASGAGRAKTLWENSLPVLDREGYTYHWEYSDPQNISLQLQRAVREYGAQVIIAIGGDGILYHAVNALIVDDKLISDDLIFAAYPAGSACDFGRTVFPHGVPELNKLLSMGEIRPIDIGRCLLGNDKIRYFINSFDMGAGADTCVKVNANSGRVKRFWRNGKIAFKLTALQILMNFKYTPTTIELPDRKIEGEYIIMGCGNGAYIGGGMKLFPHAALDDGKLEVLLVPRMTRLKILGVFSKVYDGTAIELPGIRYFSTESMKLTPARTLDVEMDGEIPGTSPVSISLLHRFLPLLYLPDEQ